MSIASKVLRVSARAGLVIARPIVGKDGYKSIKKDMDKEASEERAAKRKGKK